MDELAIDLDEKGRVVGEYSKTLDFNARAFQNILSQAESESLRGECIKLSQSSSDGTFWVSADEKQRSGEMTLLEQVAWAIFCRHTKGASFDPEKSGCEWWTQVRTLDPKEEPEEGEEDAQQDEESRQGKAPQKKRKTDSSSSTQDEKDEEGEEEEEEDQGEAIPLHFDKDEALTALTGLYISPALSTVTYLADLGAPTVVFPYVYSNESGSLVHERGNNVAYLSFPQSRNHLCFDGRMLHGAPQEFKSTDSESKQGTRVTFLVNIWLDHRPVGIESLSKQDALRIGLSSHGKDEAAVELTFDSPIRVTSKDWIDSDPVDLLVEEGSNLYILNVPSRSVDGSDGGFFVETPWQGKALLVEQE